MGNLCDPPTKQSYNTNASQKLAEQLGIDDRTLVRLEKVFRAIDFDGSGEVDVSEFLQFFELQRTRFSKRVFSVMDADGSGEMDFTEFLLAVWNYCTFNKYALIRFAFELYDEDQSGAIDVDEMTLMLKDVYGKKALTSSKQASHVLDKIKVLGGGLTNSVDIEVPYPIFLDFCNKHPALLFPAFHLQLTLQTKIIGRRFWEGLEKKRDRIARNIAKNGPEPDQNPNDVNFRDVMKFLAEMNESDREDALNAAMDEAVGGIDDLFSKREKDEAQAQAQREINRLKTMAQSDDFIRGGGSRSKNQRSGGGVQRHGRSSLKRSNTTGSARSSRRGSGGSAYRVESSSSSNSNKTSASISKEDLGGSLMQGGKSWKCRTCKRTNYPKHMRCQTCRKPRVKQVLNGPPLGRRQQKKEIDWASSGL
tara:strand:- start:830 stop:2092 length:1263 start_codon:yes stop_codon:yes gene_type:complete